MILKGISIYTKTRHTKGYNGSRDPYYRTHAWKKLRAYKLSINPLCEDCLDMSPPRTTPGHTADHIIPRNQGGPDSIDNLRTRCKHHNAVKTALDNPNNQ